MQSWGPVGQSHCEPSQCQPHKKTSSQPRYSFPKTTRQSLLGSGLKATSLLNIFMHTQGEASEDTRTGTEQMVKKGLASEQIDVVTPATLTCCQVLR